MVAQVVRKRVVHLKIDGAALVAELQRHHYAPVPLNVPHEQIRRMMEHAFADFIDLGPDFVHQFTWRMDDAGQNRIGLKEARPKGKPGDEDYDPEHKILFHYNLYADALARAQLDKMQATHTQRRVVLRFLGAVRQVYDGVVETVRATLLALEPSIPGVTERLFPKDGRAPDFFLRLLFYIKLVAMPHYDKSFTFAIGESAPGLYFIDNEGNLNEVEHHDGTALAFSGVNFYKRISQLWEKGRHGVKQRAEDVQPSAVALQHAMPWVRWAVVIFCGEHDAPGVNSDETRPVKEAP